MEQERTEKSKLQVNSVISQELHTSDPCLLAWRTAYTAPESSSFLCPCGCCRPILGHLESPWMVETHLLCSPCLCCAGLPFPLFDPAQSYFLPETKGSTSCTMQGSPFSPIPSLSASMGAADERWIRRKQALPLTHCMILNRPFDLSKSPIDLTAGHLGENVN